MNKKYYELLGKQFASLLDSLKPGESLAIWRVNMNDDVDVPGSWGCQLLEPDERMDDEVPAYRDGIECYSANLPSWQEALKEAGLITIKEEMK